VGSFLASLLKLSLRSIKSAIF